MAIKPIPTFVAELTEYARKERGGIFSLTWERFGRLGDRVQFKKAFLETIQEKLKENDVLIAYGEHIIVIVNDKHFA